MWARRVRATPASAAIQTKPSPSGTGGRAAVGLDPTPPLARASAALDVECARLIADWRERLNTLDQTETVRAIFADSLVVFVLGKVKAGKSSLGNYVAYGASQPDAETRATSPVTFFTAATSQAAAGRDEAVESNDHFRVGVAETTTAVQGFRWPGLVWVDSPGLHSTVAANGAPALK